MKKFFTLIILSFIGVCTLGTSAEAQPVVVSNRCCDTANVIRCVQVNFTPVGTTCFCPGQGYGHTC